MSQPTQPILNPQTIIRALLIYRARWVAPLLIITASAIAYAIFMTPPWEASQSLLVRDEAAGGLSRPGRFADLDSMKSAQETVLELVRSQGVIQAALEEVGPAPHSLPTAAWPTPQDVQKTLDTLQLKAPRGAEFGSTEVFYLHVKDRDPRRAVALTRAICTQLDARLRELRDRRAQSLVNELTHMTRLAQADLDTATARLSAIEGELANDLAELRILNESIAGESNLRQSLIAIKNELRQARLGQRTSQQLLEMLVVACQDPNRLIATPNGLLEAQPALRQMKDALVSAQLRTSGLLGELSSAHPKVQAAQTAEAQIQQNLYRELVAAIAGLEADLALSTDRIDSLEQQHEEVSARMGRLAHMRATYDNLVGDVRNRNETLKLAEQDLSEARASQAAAQSVSLLTLLDNPSTGDHPSGPSKTMVVLCGLCGGLLTGLGIVFLTVPQELPGTIAQGPLSLEAQNHPVETSASTVPLRGLSLKQALARLILQSPSWN